MTTTRAKGTVYRSYRQICPTGEGGGGGGGGEGGGGSDELLLDTTLTAAARMGGVLFSASRIELGGEFERELEMPSLLSFMAVQISSRRGMEILRGIFGEGPEESFSAEHTGRSASARVEPPSPFSGSAEFAAEPDGTVRWTGDLSVTFPGTGPVRLAGKRFRARLCVRNRCAGDRVGASSQQAVGFAPLRERALARLLP